jgi:hypothetical protein
MTEWIKCNDRMPDRWQWVLVTNLPKETGEPHSINIWRWKGDEWDALNLETDSPTYSDEVYPFYLWEVTHWMPLPKPPEDI